MRTAIIALAAVAFVAQSPKAQAHARLDHAQPAVGSTVGAAPKELSLWFTEAVEPKFSSIEVRDAKGAAVERGTAHGVTGNTAELRVGLKALRPGLYTVKWRALSVDTHRTQGSFTFTVAP